MSWKTVIGLEVHVQLETASKLFCGCPNQFGEAPNTLVCPVCLGYPGALPVLNRRAVTHAVRAGLAFGCTIDRVSRFDRKNYFYPDLPKGYQISQFYQPYATGGAVPFELDGDARQVPLVRIHIEEDAGKSLHEQGDLSRIDLNRCGTPLLEIVTEPVIESAEEASGFLRAVRDTMRWIGVSDANMEEGSLRCDVNLSLRERDSDPLGTRTEVKNLNSFAFVEDAIAVERARQAELLDRGESVIQETRLFDPERGETAGMRGKEEAHDYRYFPEPDLPPVKITDAEIEAERRAIPELPAERRARYREGLGLPESDVGTLTARRGTSDYFEGLLAAGVEARTASNWIRSEVMRALNERRIPIEEYPIDPETLAQVVAAVEADKISVAAGREVLARAVEEGSDPLRLLEEQDEQVSAPKDLAAWVDQVIDENAEAVAKIRDGDRKPLGFLTGQVMQLSGGRANPKAVSALLAERLGG